MKNTYLNTALDVPAKLVCMYVYIRNFTEDTTEYGDKDYGNVVDDGIAGNSQKCTLKRMRLRPPRSPFIGKNSRTSSYM